MRPASIIFLVIGLLLVITGSVICGRAERLATDDGFNLLESETDETGNAIKTFEITKQTDDDPEVLKLAINLENMNLEIVGGESRSYVEVYNKPAIFNCYISNKVMTVSNRFKLAELVQSSGSNLEFNGIRKYMNFSIFETRPQKVIIHLSDADTLKQIELNLTGGNIRMTGVQQNIDLIIKSTGAHITLQDIRTESMISAKTEGGSLTMTNLLFSEMDLEATDCICSLNEKEYGTLYTFGYTVSCAESTLTVNGAPIFDPVFTYASNMEHRFNATVKGGSISLEY